MRLEHDACNLAGELVDDGLRILHMERLLVDGRWERDVRVAVSGDGTIGSISPGAPPGSAERVYGWTVPGIPNLHSHSFQRGMAGLAEGVGRDSFWSWRETMYSFLLHLGPEDLQAISAQLYLEMLKAGFTCVGEFHYLHHQPDGRPYASGAELSLRVMEAARQSGIGLVLIPVLYEVGGFGGDSLAGSQRRFHMDLDGLQSLGAQLGPMARSNGQRLGWGVHSLRAVPEASLTEATPFLNGDPSTRVHIHVAEQEREVAECQAARGAGPVEWLLGHTEVDERWCLIHATHVTAGEMASVAEAGATVGLCPTTEANLGDGIFPLREFAGLGGRFGIGTDSHVSRSPVEELRLLEYGQRLRDRRRAVLVPDVEPGDGPDGEQAVLSGSGGTLLAQAWPAGPAALGWPGGSVQPGLRADLVVLDGDHPALVGRTGPAVLDSWVFSGTESPVRDVLIGGEWVVKDRRHRAEEDIGRDFRTAMKRLADRI